LLNNDAVATKGLVAALLAAARGNPKAALVSPRIDWAGQQVSYYWYQPYLALVTRNQFPGSFPYLSGCCLLVDAALLVEGPLFDEDFFMYGEDVELSARAVQAGRKIMCVPGAMIFHNGAGSSHMGSLFYEFHVVKGHLLLASKLPFGFTQHSIARFIRILMLGARAALRTVRYRSLIPTQALIRALRSTPFDAQSI
jgi:hypothetical protein